MPFVKVVKNKAYFKRYQVKYRRRREGKTDYFARKRLVVNDKNKYATPKYRFVVRFTNTQVICQVAYAGAKGDVVMASAYSSELPRYGLKAGLSNYSAAYCTGLLLARRLLTQLGMADAYEGNTEVTGEIVKTVSGKRTFFVSALADRRPFRAYLDVGIRRTTTGAKLFGALKGAVDGGLDIPHNPKRFPGYDEETKTYYPEAHRDKIFGDHVAEYMKHIKETAPSRYDSLFASYVAAGVDADGLEDLYASVHAAIRADPSPAAKKVHDGPHAGKSNRVARRSYEQRKDRIRQKKAARARALAAAEAAAEDDE